MKKLLLATAIAALSVSAANAAPTVYGKAYVALDYVDTDSSSLEINSHASRIGFKGSEAMTANTDVIYQLEYGVAIDGEDRTFQSRDTFLGLKNNTYGEIRVGRNQSSLDRTNNVVTADGGYWDNLGSKDNMVDSGRIDNSVIWTAPKYQGLPLQVSAMYATKENSASKDGYGVAMMFDQGTGFTAGLAYDKDLNLVSGYGETGDIIRGTATVDLAKFMAVPVTLGALYQEADIDGAAEKEKGFVISAAMGLTNFAKPVSVYAQYNNTSNLRGAADVDSDQIVVGGKYFYQKNMIMHAYAGQNDSDLNADKTLAIGTALEYIF